MQFHEVTGFNALSAKERCEILKVVTHLAGRPNSTVRYLEHAFGSLPKKLAPIASECYGQYLLMDCVQEVDLYKE